MSYYKMYQIGVDEAGRGPLFGPIYASAVILNPNKDIHIHLKDSKKMTKNRRNIVSEWIKQESICWSIAAIPKPIIDSINIKRATLLAMELSIRKISSFLNDSDQKETEILIDGIDFKNVSNFYNYENLLLNDNVNLPNLLHPMKSTSVIQGDDKFPCISAASVLAKVSRDSYIENIVKEYPILNERYSLSSNMGYGTEKHMNGLKSHGYTNFHRSTFLKNININETIPIFSINQPQSIHIEGNCAPDFLH